MNSSQPSWTPFPYRRVLIAIGLASLFGAASANADQSVLREISDSGKLGSKGRPADAVPELRKACAHYSKTVSPNLSFYLDDGVTSGMAPHVIKEKRDAALHLGLLMRNVFRDVCQGHVKITRARTAADADYVIVLTIEDSGPLVIAERPTGINVFKVRWTMTGRGGFADAREVKNVLTIKDGRLAREVAMNSVLAGILLRSASATAPKAQAVGDAPPPYGYLGSD